MNASAPYIPPRTRSEMASPAPPGGRHAQMVKVAVPLVGNGLQPQAVFAQLRSMYGSDVPDSEIAGVIRWASEKHFSPCHPRYFGSVPARKTSAAAVSPVERIKKFLRGSNVEGMTFDDLEVELWERSPWRPLEDWRIDPIMFFAGSYHAGEKINIVTDYSIELDEQGKEKAKPRGCGRTLKRDDWMRETRDHRTPESKAGAWIRMNPTDGRGISDKNMTGFRFVLIEFDHVALDLQIALLVKLKLPVAAILTSGGRSIHAWLRLDAKNGTEYSHIVGALFAKLAPFGVCLSNKNPSRLSRLPGALRVIGASDDGRQRLLFFHPDVTEWRKIL